MTEEHIRRLMAEAIRPKASPDRPATDILRLLAATVVVMVGIVALIGITVVTRI